MAESAMSVTVLEEVADPEGARSAVAAALQGSGDAPACVIVPLQHADALAWLAAQPGHPRAWFAERDRVREVAGIGHFACLEGEDGTVIERARRADRDLPPEARPPWLYTARFDPKTEAGDAWERFGCVRAQRFAVTLWREPTGCRLVVLRGTSVDPALAAWLAAAPGAALGEVPHVQYRRDDPDRDAWGAAVRTACKEIDDGELEKVVLARQRTFVLDAGLDPHVLAHALGLAGDPTFRFLIAPTAGEAFVGASPELLYARSHRSLETEALAGTRPRGASEAEDERLEQELSESEKDQREHALVGAHLSRALERLTSTLPTLAQPAMRRLTNVQHLWTAVSAKLRDDASDADLLAALAPTPAVCGAPGDVALEAIRFYEGFDRGLYAGIVGLIAEDDVVLSVAIRSALIHDDELTAYAGAGIVRGSDAEDEWNETEMKMAPMAAALEQPGDD